MERLRVGVIGLGAFAESHIQAYQGLPNVELVAVASRSPARASAVAAHYGIPTWYGSYDELIADAAIDAVSITTAESDHRAPALGALAAGKHVLLEKPLAASWEDARAIVAAARAAPGILVPGHLLRFEPKYAALREAAVQGALGRLVAISARRNRPRSLITGYARVHPALVTAIHDVDLMLWVAQQPVRWVRAIDRLADWDGGAHGLWGLLEFEGGIVGTIETVWLVPEAAGLGTDDAFAVIGLEGTAKLQLDLPALRLWRTGGSETPDVSYEPRLHGAVSGALKEELAHFVGRALAGQPSPIVTPADGLTALAVVLALIESARLGTTVAPQAGDEPPPEHVG